MKYIEWLGAVVAAMFQAALRAAVRRQHLLQVQAVQRELAEVKETEKLAWEIIHDSIPRRQKLAHLLVALEGPRHG